MSLPGARLLGLTRGRRRLAETWLALIYGPGRNAGPGAGRLLAKGAAAAAVPATGLPVLAPKSLRAGPWRDRERRRMRMWWRQRGRETHRRTSVSWGPFVHVELHTRSVACGLQDDAGATRLMLTIPTTTAHQTWHGIGRSLGRIRSLGRQGSRIWSYARSRESRPPGGAFSALWRPWPRRVRCPRARAPMYRPAVRHPGVGVAVFSRRSP
jgi:hypothetical protein